MKILRHYGLEAEPVEPVEVGLINETYQIGERYILQKLNPIFGAKVHLDIDAVTRHVEAKGLETARLVPTQAGALWVEEEGEVWRLQTFVPGEVHTRLQSTEMAKSAGALLGRFHAALSDLNHTFENQRLGVHDTARHVSVLRESLQTHGSHPRHDEVAPLLEEILADAEGRPLLPPLPDRVVHGDPKISNIVFRGEVAVAMIDLDTLAKMPVVLELGDAFRSWCNPAGEDTDAVRFDLDLFEAAMEGYASTGQLSVEERDAIADAIYVIIIELAARFGADVLNERYFGWRQDRFPTRGHHNELRAKGQLSLARSYAESRAKVEQVIRRAFDR